MKKLLVLMIIMHIGLCYAQKPTDWKEPKEIREILTAAGDEAGLPRGLAHCVAYRESRFKVNALSEVVNRYRSCGVMQLYRRYLYGDNGLIQNYSSKTQDDFVWYDPIDNSEVGCRYLSYLINRFGGSVYLGLIAYRWGPTNLANIDEWKDIPPYARHYADSILKNLDAWDESW